MTSDIVLQNSHIMVRELVRKEDETTNHLGLYIPEQTLEDEQVAQGTVVRSACDSYSQGDVVMFHKVMPVDVNMKLDGDADLNRYFFIKESDVICKVITK